MLKRVNTLSQILGLASVQLRSHTPKLSQHCARNSNSINAQSQPNFVQNAGEIAQSKDPVNNYTKLFKQAEKTLSGQCLHVFKMQSIWSLRASEALFIQNEDFLFNGLIIIKAKKHSKKRLIYYPDLSQFYNPDPVYSTHRIFTISYTAYYNALKRAGISFQRDRKTGYNIVTHAMRKYNLGALQELANLDMTELLSHSGHASRAGADYYLGNNSLFRKAGKNGKTT